MMTTRIQVGPTVTGRGDVVARALIRVRIADLERLYRPIPAVTELARWRQV